MTNYHELVPIPPRTDINSGLTAAKNSTLLALYGAPGRLTRDCSPVTNARLRQHIVRANVGPFTVEGWRPAVESLKRVFTAVKEKDAALYGVVRSSGMLCCRAVRGSTTSFSNHSWGCAIDLRILSRLDELGALKVQRGILLLYPHFHKEGWFWGAGYSGRKDVMHYEAANETIKRWYKELHG